MLRSDAAVTFRDVITIIQTCMTSTQIIPCSHRQVGYVTERYKIFCMVPPITVVEAARGATLASGRPHGAVSLWHMGIYDLDIPTGEEITLTLPVANGLSWGITGFGHIPLLRLRGLRNGMVMMHLDRMTGIPDNMPAQVGQVTICPATPATLA